MYYSFHAKVKEYQLFTINTVNQLLKVWNYSISNILCYGFVMKNCVFMFEKDFLFTKHLFFCLKRPKLLRVTAQQSLLFSLTFYTCVLHSTTYKKIQKIVFF